MGEARPSARRGDPRAAVLIVSALVHGALALLLVRHLAQAPAYAEGPILQVSLVPPPLRADRGTPPRRLPVRREPRETTVAPRIAVPQPDAAPRPPGPTIPGDDPSARARQALRGLAGCDRPGLSRDERERCETRRWAATPPPARLDLDPTGRYAENPEPFLSRRPAKGCRVRAAGDIDAMGETGNVRGGVTCVVPF